MPLSAALCTSPIGLAAWALAPGVLGETCTLKLALAVPGAPWHVPYIPYLAATLALEGTLLYPLLRRLGKRRWLVIAALLSVNLASHPAAFYLLPTLAARAHLTYAAMLLGAEAFAIGVEAALFWRFFGLKPRTALAVATAVNLWSWGLSRLW